MFLIIIFCSTVSQYRRSSLTCAKFLGTIKRTCTHNTQNSLSYTRKIRGYLHKSVKQQNVGWYSDHRLSDIAVPKAKFTLRISLRYSLQHL